MMATPTVSAVPIPLPPQPVEPVGVEPVEPEPAPEPVPVDGPHVRFVSARSNTERMQVSCDSGRETGGDSVAIAGAEHGDCIVTVILGDKKRLRARVEGTEPREYICFVGDSDECR